MKKNYINHVALVIDDSPSMAGLVYKTREVVNAQIKAFQTTSRLKNQETRISVYIFGGECRCVAFDAYPDSIPDARNFVHAGISATAMIDATYKAISDLQDIPTKVGDHSFLIYVVTDGEDNCSKKNASDIRFKLESLNDDWTVAALVPNVKAKHYCVTYGLPVGNIEIWDTTTVQGMETVGSTICDSYTAYTSARSVGLKSTKTLFSFPEIKKADVQKKLEEVDPGTYETLLVRQYDDGKAIKDFVEAWTKKPYRVGSAYYQVTKPEKIQAGKNVAVVEKSTGKMFSGLKARSLLGLPSAEVKVAPADFARFDLFVQSTSTNRKLVSDTHVIVFT